jgi:hypothetical protein
MSWEFSRVDLKAHLHKQEDWDQAFVDKHFQKMHGLRGQRKLLLSNLLALVLAVDDMEKKSDRRRIQLLVAGASPGIHLPVLLKHLKQSNIGDRIEVHLFDPKRLHRNAAAVVHRSDNVTFTPEKFETKNAREWSERDAKKNCLIFLSDVRSDIHAKNQHSRVDEDTICGDMRMQKAWVELMQPDYSMLKFHARHATRDNPDVAPAFTYLRGTLYKQAYTDLFSAECRQFVTKEDIKDTTYSTAAIEGHMYYHNRTLRPQTYAVHNQKLQYDEAFQAYVAQEAARVLGINAHSLLQDAHDELEVDPIVFTWPVAPRTHMQTLLRRVQTAL